MVSVILMLVASSPLQSAVAPAARTPPRTASTGKAQAAGGAGEPAGAPTALATGGLFSANQLRQRCLSNGPADASYCFAYVTGVHDTVRAYEAWLNLREFCVPRHVAQGDLRRAFIDYLGDHPADLAGEAASVVVVSLKMRFPCAADRPGP